MKHALTFPFAALLPLAIAACTQPSGTGPAPGELPATQVPAAASSGPPPPAARTADAAASGIAHVLDSHHWRLVDASRGGTRIDALFVRADAPVQLDFAAGRLAVSNTCNAMGGSYTLDSGVLAVAPMASTRKACMDPKLAALDAEVGRRLQGRLDASVQDTRPPRLVLATAAGERLVFEGTPTPASLYGAPERMFLEVAAQTSPCSHPLVPDMQCLQVREIRYDDAGLRQGDPGPWRNFHDDIDGYRHQPGVRNVLRIDRYTRKQVPADASKYVYVLDLVVESEAVKP